jgi:hypothetical protein
MFLQNKPDDEIRRIMTEEYITSLDERIARLKKVRPLAISLSPTHPECFAIIQSGLYEDFGDCFVDGRYTAVIATSCTLVEALLHMMVETKLERNVNGLSCLIYVAEAAKLIDKHMASELHMLRKIRNSYVHFSVKKIKHTVKNEVGRLDKLGKKFAARNPADFATPRNAEKSLCITQEFIEKVWNPWMNNG